MAATNDSANELTATQPIDIAQLLDGTRGHHHLGAADAQNAADEPEQPSVQEHP